MEGLLTLANGCCKVGASEHLAEILRLKAAGHAHAEIARRIEAEHGEKIYERSFSVHFAKHASVAEASEELEIIKEKLREDMASAPPTVAPLYLLVLQNLGQLESTKASQKDLISALKSIHEITGMQLRQRLLVSFAEARARRNGPPRPGNVAEGDGGRVVRLPVVQRAAGSE